MKTLQLSTIVLLLSSAFYSCTKDLSAPTNPTGAANSQGSDKATASIVNFNINPKPVYKSSTVEITGTLQFTRAVNRFNVILEKSTEKNAAGEWINFVETTYKENVDLDKTGQGNNQQNVTATTFPFKFTFPAKELGVRTTGWRVHVTGGDVHNDWVGNATLDILEDPCVQTFTVTSDVAAEDQGNGNFKFTVTYQLTSPNAIGALHFQGGATSGGQFQHELVDDELVGLVVRKKNNQNTILQWDGALEPCQPVTLSFSYIRKFACPAEAATVTGEWTATAAGMEPYTVAPLTYSCNPDGTKK